LWRSAERSNIAALKKRSMKGDRDGDEEKRKQTELVAVDASRYRYRGHRLPESDCK
jgi:hypothetical protein